MSIRSEEIEINGVKYIEKDSSSNYFKTLDEYCIVRCENSGVFAGKLVDHLGKDAVMENVRCLWFWRGAASLMQLAVDGVTEPSECLFTVRVSFIKLTDVIQVLPCTQKAIDSIEGVKEWKA